MIRYIPLVYTWQSVYAYTHDYIIPLSHHYLLRHFPSGIWIKDILKTSISWTLGHRTHLSFIVPPFPSTSSRPAPFTHSLPPSFTPYTSLLDTPSFHKSHSLTFLYIFLSHSIPSLYLSLFPSLTPVPTLPLSSSVIHSFVHSFIHSLSLSIAPFSPRCFEITSHLVTVWLLARMLCHAICG